MSELSRIIAAHPLRKKPYNAIKFVRVNGDGTPLYRVCKDPRDLGAAEALKLAFETMGAHCFHCLTWIPPQPLAGACTRDHIRPRKDGGRDYLHNLVFSCALCNSDKGASDIVSFNVERGSEYLKALDEHLARCIAHIDD